MLLLCDTDIIIPFFEKHKLRAKKKHDFELWKEAVYLLNKNKGLKTNIATTRNNQGKRSKIWNQNDLVKLKNIHETMKQFKSKIKEWKWIDKI
ncbi:MAG: hypothetical protein NTW60_02415 [Candidatus Wolfebacteria bacterium]|nr:hypothetical protein [Candidatus Wolfebacteria bacterium]